MSSRDGAIQRAQVRVGSYNAQFLLFIDVVHRAEMLPGETTCLDLDPSEAKRLHERLGRYLRRLERQGDKA